MSSIYLFFNIFPSTESSILVLSTTKYLSLHHETYPVRTFYRPTVPSLRSRPIKWRDLDSGVIILPGYSGWDEVRILKVFFGFTRLLTFFTKHVRSGRQLTTFPSLIEYLDITDTFTDDFFMFVLQFSPLRYKVHKRVLHDFT